MNDYQMKTVCQTFTSSLKKSMHLFPCVFVNKLHKGKKRNVSE